MSECHFVPLSSYNFSYNAKFPLPWNPTVYCLIAAISAVPMYMTIELTFQLYATFKKYNGLYFWSILFTTWALTIRQVGRVFVYFVPGCSKVFTLLFAMVGWCGTVTGFSVVLYSRLHLVVHNKRTLHLVLAMIIIDAIILEVPTMIGQIGTVAETHKDWISWYPTMEKIQITGFAIQETIISSIYICAARHIVKDSHNILARTSVRMLVIVQLFAITCHIPLIALAFADYFVIKASMQSLVYAIKLKLEFIVLNHLLDIVKYGIAPRGILHDAGQNADAEVRAHTNTTTDAPKRRLTLGFGTRRRSPTSSPDDAEKQAGTGLGEIRNAALDDNRVPETPSPQQDCTHLDDVIRPHPADELSLTDSERKYLGKFVLQR